MLAIHINVDTGRAFQFTFSSDKEYRPFALLRNRPAIAKVSTPGAFALFINTLFNVLTSSIENSFNDGILFNSKRVIPDGRNSEVNDAVFGISTPVMPVQPDKSNFIRLIIAVKSNAGLELEKSMFFQSIISRFRLLAITIDDGTKFALSLGMTKFLNRFPVIRRLPFIALAPRLSMLEQNDIP